MFLQTTLEGSLTRKPVNLSFQACHNEGITFVFADGSTIEANYKNVLSATRNTVLGNLQNRICFVEHLLAVINLLGISGIQITVNAPEIPLADGSGAVWLDLLQDWPARKEVKAEMDLKQAISVSDETGRSICAIPSSEFKMTYLFSSPVDGAQTWTSWTANDGIECLIKARTFGPAKEHEMLGMKGKVLSYDSTGFDLPLNSPDEPALHKLLDLFGDLSLSGINPLKLKAHFISFKGGHALNTQMAFKLAESLTSAASAV